MTIFTPYNWKVFNDLDSLLGATKSLDAAGKSQVLERLFKIIRAYKLEHVVGVQLLHRHFALNENEMVLESDAGKNRSTAVVVKCDAIAAEGQRRTPTVFRAVKTGKGGVTYAPLEFTDEKAACAAYAHIQKQTEFLSAFAKELLALNLESSVGLGLVDPRNLVAKAQKLSGYKIIETTEFKNRRLSTALYSPAEVEALGKGKSDKSFEAWWSADPSLGDEYCQVECYIMDDEEEGQTHMKFHHRG